MPSSCNLARPVYRITHGQASRVFVPADSTDFLWTETGFPQPFDARSTQALISVSSRKAGIFGNTGHHLAKKVVTQRYLHEPCRRLRFAVERRVHSLEETINFWMALLDQFLNSSHLLFCRDSACGCELSAFYPAGAVLALKVCRQPY